MAEVEGGKALDAYMKKLSKLVSKSAVVNVGFLEGREYPDGTSVAEVAAIQNFGAPAAGIPPRPFFSNMVEAHKDEWGPEVAKILPTQDYDPEKTLALMGARMVGQLQDSIAETFEPALSPVTVMIRKMKRESPGLVVTGATVGEAASRLRAGEGTEGTSDKPLVDTGYMLSQVDYEVKA